MDAQGNGASGRDESKSVTTSRARTGKRVWVQNVDVTVSLLEARLDTLRARRTAERARLAHDRRAGSRRVVDTLQRLDAEDALDGDVRSLLRVARRAAKRQEPVPNRLVNWWGGRLIEAAYQNLHAAEALMAGLYGWPEIEAEIPEAVARVESALTRDDPRALAALALREMDPDTMPLPVARAALAKTVEVGHTASDREHSRLRGFRNAVLAASLLVTLLVALFCWYVALNPDKVPLCFTPINGDGVEASWVCPTGEYPWDRDLASEHGPTSSHDVLVVALLGLLGGAFSAAIAVKGLTGTTTPYDVPLALAALKLPLGALTSTGALIALKGNFVPGLSELDSQGQILAYALVFGYAQQLLSGVLDRHAKDLLEATPSRDRGVTHTLPRAPMTRTGGSGSRLSRFHRGSRRGGE